MVGRTVTHLAREASLGRRLAAVARVMTSPGAGKANMPTSFYLDALSLTASCTP